LIIEGIESNSIDPGEKIFFRYAEIADGYRDAKLVPERVEPVNQVLNTRITGCAGKMKMGGDLSIAALGLLTIEYDVREDQPEGSRD
jgi:hypothetical protein